MHFNALYGESLPSWVIDFSCGNGGLPVNWMTAAVPLPSDILSDLPQNCVWPNQTVTLHLDPSQMTGLFHTQDVLPGSWYSGRDRDSRFLRESSNHDDVNPGGEGNTPPHPTPPLLYTPNPQ
ncbi:hypothetical protein SKAU_G00362970 [Synaphobranchus kaupii]|uniref:Uncharacterized protein n=1 Tax=Synaphobranchus kaupii TaxID=118154 RepID=A0A9Q1IHA3_SYNKA|nr:hypothetical protein SKAU_G00362970 [Synaphobranchus kaupii]